MVNVYNNVSTDERSCLDEAEIFSFLLETSNWITGSNTILDGKYLQKK
jgi:hypothetical protein